MPQMPAAIMRASSDNPSAALTFEGVIVMGVPQPDDGRKGLKLMTAMGRLWPKRVESRHLVRRGMLFGGYRD